MSNMLKGKGVLMPDRIISDAKFWNEVISRTSDNVLRKEEIVDILAHYGDFYKKDMRFALNLLIEILETAVLRGEKIDIRGLFELTIMPSGGYENVGLDGKKRVVNYYEKVYLKPSVNIKNMTRKRVELKNKK